MTQTLLQLPFTLLAQAPAGPPAAASSALRIESVWDFVVKGGPVMIPIGICSLVALAVIVERFVTLRRTRIIPPGFLPGLKASLAQGQKSRAEALEYCRANECPVASIFACGIRRLGEPTELLEKHVQEAGEREVTKLQKYLRVLSLIASISTLLGLLGTILGLINAFQTVAASGEALGKTELLAKGIYEAMITTAAGLFVAIPVVIAYHAIAAKVQRLVSEMDQMTVDFLEQYGTTSAAAVSAPAHSAGGNGDESVGALRGTSFTPISIQA